MDWLGQIVGVGLVILALIDIYLTVLFPRLGSGVLSLPLRAYPKNPLRCKLT